MKKPYISDETMKKMTEFFSKTSIPRILKEKEKEKENVDN